MTGCPLCGAARITERLATTGESVVCCDNPHCAWTLNDEMPATPDREDLALGHAEQFVRDRAEAEAELAAGKTHVLEDVAEELRQDEP